MVRLLDNFESYDVILNFRYGEFYMTRIFHDTFSYGLLFSFSLLLYEVEKKIPEIFIFRDFQEKNQFNKFLPIILL